MNGTSHPSSRYQKGDGEGKRGYDRRPSRWQDDVLRALRTYRLRLSRAVCTVKVYCEK